MSIYDQRDKPAYRHSKIDPQYAKNQYILKWWNSTLDELLATQISTCGYGIGSSLMKLSITIR
jgi:hypothetical protein